MSSAVADFIRWREEAYAARGSHERGTPEHDALTRLIALVGYIETFGKDATRIEYGFPTDANAGDPSRLEPYDITFIDRTEVEEPPWDDERGTYAWADPVYERFVGAWRVVES